MSETDPFRQITRGIYTCLENTGGASYDFKAGYYERLVSTHWFNRLFWDTSRNDYQEFAAKAILRTAGTVLDIGCGGLAQTAQLYRATSNDCILLDRSLEMLKIARARLSADNGQLPSHIQLLQGNAFQLPFPDNTFDIVCSFGTIHLFDNKREFVDEALRVLKPGGRCYFYSMTNERKISRVFMSSLRLIHEFGEVYSAAQTLSLFHQRPFLLQSHLIGSTIFIEGRKME
ncbi:class I SAM-dependent methyltransferase [Chitinophaga sp. G-6-1-13]|uniref:Class I SAM-dependent methyltransferase n=1 Tax=Chitinophaga fulva TaxID=2728842 RepID=A0A848GM96_9BACT|nr:class I SAM-dependent methyltransferase [Chitinophaga fulva]NML38092.1 class I SAM-dependent methyltransferase [Chitinophaga fulva]